MATPARKMKKKISRVIALFSVAILSMAVAVVMNQATADNTDHRNALSNMPAGLYKLDRGHASLVWRVDHLGLSNYTARFTDFDAELILDPQRVENSSLTVTVNPASIRTDYPFSDEKDFDKVLSEGEGWFNSLKFPEITFNATNIVITGDNKGVVNGELTFLGVTKPLVLNVVLNGAMESHPFSEKAVMGFSATTTLSRSEWGMDQYVPHIGDDVSLQIEVEFLKAEDE